MFVKKLKNKLTILTYECKSPSTEIGICVLGGIMTESSKCIEYYHLLEHVLNGFPSDKAAPMPDDYKITSGAEVSNYITHAFLKTVSREPQAYTTMLDTIVSCLEQFRISEQQLSTIKNDIVEEIKQETQTPFYKHRKRIDSIFTPFHSMCAGHKSRIESVSDVTLDGVTQFVQHALTPDRIVLYFAGNKDDFGLINNYKSRLQTIQQQSPVFSVSRLNNYTVKDARIGLYYTFEDSVSTTITCRWRLPATRYDYGQKAVIDFIGDVMYNLLYTILKQERLVTSIEVDTYYDDTNATLSHMDITCDCLTQSKSKDTILRIVNVLDQIHSSDEVLGTLFNNDTVKQYIIDKIENQEEPQTTDESDTESILPVHIVTNISQVLWDRRVTTRKQLTKHDNGVRLDEVVQFFKQNIVCDNMYMFYSGPYKLFNQDA